MAIRSLFVTSEMAGFIKAGGLGDVAASLQRALHHRGMDIRILIPAYPAVLAAASSMELVEICRAGDLRPAQRHRLRDRRELGSHGNRPAHSLLDVQPSGKATVADIVRTSLCLAPLQGPLFGMVSRLVPRKRGSTSSRGSQ